MTASEARKKTEQYHELEYGADYQRVMKQIEQEVAKGKYNLIITYKVHELALKRLKKEGYSVYQEIPEMGGYYLKIGW